MTKFSEYLQRNMDHRGWKQADLARAAGTSSKNVSVWMSKGVIPNAEGLEKIAKAFGASEDEVRRAAGEAPKSGYFKLSPERQEDAGTLDREQARIVDELIRKFADDNRKVVAHDADGEASNMRAAGSAAEEDDSTVHEADFSADETDQEYYERRYGRAAAPREEQISHDDPLDEQGI